METKPAPMTTLTDVLEMLTERKQANEFKMTADGFTTDDKRFYSPGDLTIVKTYRFEGESDPSDSSILYLIETSDGRMGYSIDAYGAYSNHDEDYDDFIQKVKVEDRDEQILFGKS